MKIFVVDQSLFSPLYDAQFCEALAEVGHDVTLIGRPLRPEEEQRARGYRTLPFFYRLSERALARIGPRALALKGVEHGLDMRRLLRLVEQQQPDIVHFEWILLPFIDRYFFKSLGERVPIILTVHNATAFHGGGSSRLMRIGPEQVFNHVAHFIPHTESTANYLASFDIMPDRWTQIQHPAIDLPDPKIEDQPTDGRTTILLFGALKPYKGIDVLIEAALELASRRQDFRVVIAGKPFMPFDDLKAKIQAAGQDGLVTFDLRLLPDRDLAAHIKRADIVVFPYREIDASGALACACQFGKPIIASQIGTFDEAPARGHVRPIPPADQAGLVQALEQMLDDPEERGKWAEKSRTLKSLIPSWQQFAEQCTSIYERHRRK
ncbi:MAG: glycosyltransferase [Pseudomonadota bacterium]